MDSIYETFLGGGGEGGEKHFFLNDFLLTANQIGEEGNVV